MFLSSELLAMNSEVDEGVTYVPKGKRTTKKVPVHRQADPNSSRPIDSHIATSCPNDKRGIAASLREQQLREAGVEVESSTTTTAESSRPPTSTPNNKGESDVPKQRKLKRSRHDAWVENNDLFKQALVEVDEETRERCRGPRPLLHKS